MPLVVGVARAMAPVVGVAVGVIVGDDEGEALAEAVGEELAVDVSRGVGDCVGVGLGVTLGDGLALVAGSGSAPAAVSVALDHKIGLYCGAVALRFGAGERQNAASVPGWVALKSRCSTRRGMLSRRLAMKRRGRWFKNRA
jgi:hypothetical protein